DVSHRGSIRLPAHPAIPSLPRAGLLHHCRFALRVAPPDPPLRPTAPPRRAPPPDLALATHVQPGGSLARDPPPPAPVPLVFLPLAQARVTALREEVVYSLETMLALLLAATASRFPEPDSQARSALSRSTGPTFVVAIAAKFPQAVPSQIQALTWAFVKSPPI